MAQWSVPTDWMNTLIYVKVLLHYTVIWKNFLLDEFVKDQNYKNNTKLNSSSLKCIVKQLLRSHENLTMKISFIFLITMDFDY